MTSSHRILGVRYEALNPCGGATGSWFEIRYNNRVGFVAARDFALTAPATPTEPTEQYGPEREVQVVSFNTFGYCNEL
ncbi:hypothetical protein ACW7EJ_00630 [Acinetobacter soli]